MKPKHLILLGIILFFISFFLVSMCSNICIGCYHCSDFPIIGEWSNVILFIISIGLFLTGIFWKIYKMVSKNKK